MDETHFDIFARTLAQSSSRRRFLSSVLVSCVAFIVGKSRAFAQFGDFDDFGDCGFDQTKCGFTCTNLLADSNNCGGCGTRCGFYSETCRDGQCQCIGIDEVKCGNSCADLSRDPNNCGGCGIRCAIYSETCQGGECISIAPPTRETTQSTIADQNADSCPDSSANVDGSLDCAVVELYPGYPGYRGYVAGIDGPGEAACLDELTAVDSSFDKSREDEANIAAARAIGLTGSPSEWTWENWMAIEAERGLPPTCYSCLFTQQNVDCRRKTAPTDIFDQRLWLGGYGTTEALLRATEGAGMGTDFSSFFIERFGGDHVLRAFIGSNWPGHHSAPEMLAAYSILFADYAKPGTLFIDTHQMWSVMLSQGGYAPTPSAAHIEDQMYMIRLGVEAMCAPGAITECEYLVQSYEQLVEAEFKRDLIRSGSHTSYAEWLREHFSDFV